MPQSPRQTYVQCREEQKVEFESLDAVTAESSVKKGSKRSQPEEPEDGAEPQQWKKHKKKGQLGESVVHVASEAQEVNDDAADEVELEAAEFRAKMQIQIISVVDVPDPVQTFDASPFSKTIRNGLKSAGFGTPTAIQSQAWPIAVQGKDFIGIAKTGSGKTLAFLLPAFSLLTRTKPDCSQGPAVLVLAPTRELAVQIEEVAVKFGLYAKVSCCVVYGGAPKPPQVEALRSRPQVVVATPGRLVDLITDHSIKLGSVLFLVLDEADRMLDMGFEPQMLEIMRQIPSTRQTLLFSATWPKSIRKLASTYLKEAVHVNIGETDELAANKSVVQKFIKANDEEKEDHLWKFLDSFTDKEKCIVFANTKRRVHKLAKDVWDTGYHCVVMSGDMSQNERNQGLADFSTGKAQVMFATDVCARGLDIKAVNHIVNYDMARDVDSYIHRIGRSGRAGSSGTSITYVNEDFDIPCTPALIKIAKEAGQEVPTWLEKLALKAPKTKKDKQWRY